MFSKIGFYIFQYSWSAYILTSLLVYLLIIMPIIMIWIMPYGMIYGILFHALILGCIGYAPNVYRSIVSIKKENVFVRKLSIMIGNTEIKGDIVDVYEIYNDKHRKYIETIFRTEDGKYIRPQSLISKMFRSGPSGNS